jgi:hypothetical protein
LFPLSSSSVSDLMISVVATKLPMRLSATRSGNKSGGASYQDLMHC